MISRYGIFCKVIETGNFTRAAEMLGYSQSAVSQTIKSLESELGFTLIDRRKDGIRLTSDGEQFYTYIHSIYSAELSLEQKRREMRGLENTVISIGTFNAVSRNILPMLMNSFKSMYPSVSFVLRQGSYTNIEQWILEGSVDFGFVNADTVTEVETRFLYEDRMVAVLPPEHELAKKDEVSMRDLASEPFILLNEGTFSVPMRVFSEHDLVPTIAYDVYDDYTIMAMVKQGFGLSLLYEKLLQGFDHGLEVRPVTEDPKRTIALAWRSLDTLPYASRRFTEYIIANV